MRSLRRSAALLAILAAACGPILDNGPEADRTVDVDTRARVKTALFENLVLKEAEVGPRFPDALPEIQDQIAAEEGFVDWENYLLCLRATDPGADLVLTKEITARMAELLAEVEDPEEQR